MSGKNKEDKKDNTTKKKYSYEMEVVDARENPVLYSLKKELHDFYDKMFDNCRLDNKQRFNAQQLKECKEYRQQLMAKVREAKENAKISSKLFYGVMWAKNEGECQILAEIKHGIMLEPIYPDISELDDELYDLDDDEFGEKIGEMIEYPMEFLFVVSFKAKEIK
ncbi:hypothetical protein [Helicobacter sp. T3_23-1059]